MSERFLAIIYLIFAQTLPLTICFVFDKFFLRFLPVIASCYGFIWQMTSTKKTFQSIRQRSQEVNVVQADFNAVLTSAKTVIIVLTTREACFISSVSPLLGNTLKALMTSYRLPRQHARSTKRPSKLQLLKIIGKTKSVTYRFYFFVGKLPKFFNLLESMTKSYLVEFKIHRKMAYSLQKIVLDRFPRNFFI